VREEEKRVFAAFSASGYGAECHKAISWLVKSGSLAGWPQPVYVFPMSGEITATGSVGLQRGINAKRPGGVTGKGFQPGQSGNPSGKRKNCVSLSAALKRALTPETADEIAASLISAAKAGNLGAAKIILDRLDHPLGGPFAAVAVAQANTSNSEQAAIPEWLMDRVRQRAREHMERDGGHEGIQHCQGAVNNESGTGCAVLGESGSREVGDNGANGPQRLGRPFVRPAEIL